MVIHRTGPKASTPKSGKTASKGSLSQVLERAGLLSGKKSAKQVGQTLVGNLLQRGFGTGKGALGAQLKQAVVAFQRANGLPPTGNLDAATVSALQKQGLLQQGPQAAKDGFEKGKNAELSFRPGGGFGEGATAGDSVLANTTTQRANQYLAGMIGPKAAAENPGAAGSAAAGTPAQADAQTSAAAVPQAQTQAQAGDARPVRGLAGAALSDSRTRTEDGGTQDATGRGVKDGDPAAKKGRAGDGDQAGKIGGGDEEEGSGVDADEEGEGGLAAEGDEDGTEDEQGNAASGDDNVADPKRGHAMEDDGSETPPGYYRTPRLSQQIAAALNQIQREAEDRARTTTYSLDVTLRIPGVYGQGQKPEELLHLVVKEANAFDPVWQNARQALQRLLTQWEPDAPPPTEADFEIALRKARVRD